MRVRGGAVALVFAAVLSSSCQGDGTGATLAAGAAPSTAPSAAPSTAAAPAEAAPSTAAPQPSTTAAAPTTKATTPTTAALAPAPAALPPAAATANPVPRRVHVQAWTPFATVGGVTLRPPSNRVEGIGYHESNLDGARQLESLPTSAPWVVLEGRNRDTGGRGAADVVVDPDVEIRAPVSGKVLYAGTYVLYCKYSDDFLVIEPDDHPGWEVKLLHIDGVVPRPGQRVTAGQTVVAPRATRLPFASQVEEGAATPAWPHVHIEVDDPNIPDRPTPGGGC